MINRGWNTALTEPDPDTDTEPQGGPMLSRVEMVLLFVRDAQASLPFYRETLGMRVKSMSPGWIELDGGGVTVALHTHVGIPQKRGEAMPKVIFATDDIDDTYKVLKHRGVRFVSAPHQVHETAGVVGMAAEFQDPDGNMLSIYGTTRRGPRPL